MHRKIVINERRFCKYQCNFKKLLYLQSYSTGANNKSFYSIFKKGFDHLETLLTIKRPEKVLSAGSLCWSLVSSHQSKCPKSIMLQIPICYHSHLNVSQKTKTNTNFRGQAWFRPQQSAGSRALCYPICTMPQISAKDSGIL